MLPRTTCGAKVPLATLLDWASAAAYAGSTRRRDIDPARSRRSLRARPGQGRGGPGGWWLATDVEIQLETHEVYRPDLVGWRRERVPERPRGRPIRDRPDWVAEILSRTNAENDLGTKLFAYQRAGIPHYWIIDPEHETLTVYRHTPEGYVVHLTAGKRERVHAAPFEELEFDVGHLFGE